MTPQIQWNETDVHVMIDVETLGLAQNAIVLSIGAVVFDPTHQDRGIGDDYYAELDPERYPGSIDMSTVRFWLEKGNAPMGGQREGRHIGEHLSAWLDRACGGDRKKLVIWANGTDFDIPKLQYAYKLGKRQVPWGYSAVRDARTVYKLFDPDKLLAPVTNPSHNALDDARNQAQWLINIFLGVPHVHTNPTDSLGSATSGLSTSD